MSDEGIDAIARANEIIGDSPYRVFAYVVAERADLYVEVVSADVVAEVAATGTMRDPDEVRSALEALAEWGNVSKFYDSAAPETLDEFYGKRFLGQPTPEGCAPCAGVEAVREAGLAGGGRNARVLRSHRPLVDLGAGIDRRGFRV